MIFMLIALAVCIGVCIYLYIVLIRYVKMLEKSMGQTEQAIEYLNKSIDLNNKANAIIQKLTKDNEKLKDKLTVAEATKKDDSVKILYECDRNACVICRNIECHMTTDINHAVNFDKVSDDLYVERCRHSTMADITRSFEIDH